MRLVTTPSDSRSTARATVTTLLDELRIRLSGVRRLAADRDVDAVVVTPAADLAYLCGYAAKATERLTALVLSPSRDPVLVVPRLERPVALTGPVADLSIEVVTWEETDDPYALVASLVPGARRVALDDHMWAAKVLALRAAIPAAEQVLAGSLTRELRMRKSPFEIDALRMAGQAIDRVHARMADWVRVGRTEREVGADIAAAILDEGHVSVDFIVVGSGPNGASPHQELSDRVIESGDPVVVDIGGTTALGYCSDSTRTYAVGTAPDDFLASYEVLHAAQVAACWAVAPGVSCEQIDKVARDVISDAGYGEQFIHRTGHGIGRQTHEEPYIVKGNTLALEPGMAFSVEPGIYVEGRHGARIEDIVVCTEEGGERLNLTPRELVTLDG